MRVFFTFMAGFSAFGAVFRLTHDWITAWGVGWAIVCALIVVIEANERPRK